MKVFISYCRDDKNTAEKLYNDLKKNDLTPWIDIHDILAGENWKIAIKKAIKDSTYFIALLSSTSLSKKGFVQSELKEALEISKELPENSIFFIPVRIDECEPQDERLKKINYADLFPSYETGLDKLLKTLLFGKEKKEIVFHREQDEANEHLEKIIKEDRPKKAYLLEYSTNTIQRLLKSLGRSGTEIFLLIQHPEIAEQMAGDFQKEKICKEMENLFFKTLVDIPNMDITIRCYKQTASMRGRKFGNIINMGWYTYDIRDEINEKKQIWGHNNPMMTLKRDSKEGKIFEEAFDKIFKNLWEKGCFLKDVCSDCKKMRECTKKADERLNRVSLKKLEL